MPKHISEGIKIELIEYTENNFSKVPVNNIEDTFHKLFMEEKLVLNKRIMLCKLHIT